MNNFEACEKEIRKLGLNRIAMVNGKIENCYSTKCNYCDFQGGLCEDKKLNWLYEEYEEKPQLLQPFKLTKNERKLCEILKEDSYIARDEDGLLLCYIVKPCKLEGVWFGSGKWFNINKAFVNVTFDFIEWKDKEPWAVKDLLKLEVKGEE